MDWEARSQPEPRAARVRLQTAPLYVLAHGYGRSLIASQMEAPPRNGLPLLGALSCWLGSNYILVEMIVCELLLTLTGAFPRELACSFNVYLTTGTFSGVAFLFIIHSIFALCFAAGYRTKVMHVLCWLFHAGIMGRTIPIGHGGDMYLRCLLFWSMFLPLGKVWSVDNVLRHKQRKPRSSTYYFSSATIGILVQVISIYLFSYFLKTHEWWTTDYTAAYYALRLDFFRRPFGDFLLMFPDMLKLMTFGTLWWEALGGFFYLVPFANDYWRMFTCIAFVGLHLGFGMSLRLGTFMWIGIVGQFGLIPGWFWDAVVFKFLRTHERLGLKTFFLVPGTEVAPAVSSASEDYSKDEMHTSIHPMSLTRANPTDDWVVIDYAGYSHYGFDALVEICSQSPLLRFVPTAVLRMVWPLVDVFHPRHKAAESRPPKKAKHTNLSMLFKYFVRVSVNVALLFLVICTIGWNLSHMKVDNPATRFNDIGIRLGIDQYWGMFSPRPPDVDFWYTIEGNTSANTNVEMWRNGGFFTWEPNNVTFDKPDPVWVPFRNHRWFKYFEVYNQASKDGMRLGLGRYICREFNERHPDAKVHIFRVWVIEERHFLNGSAEIFSKLVLWEHKCW